MSASASRRFFVDHGNMRYYGATAQEAFAGTGEVKQMHYGLGDSSPTPPPPYALYNLKKHTQFIDDDEVEMIQCPPTPEIIKYLRLLVVQVQYPRPSIFKRFSKWLRTPFK